VAGPPPPPPLDFFVKSIWHVLFPKQKKLFVVFLIPTLWEKRVVGLSFLWRFCTFLNKGSSKTPLKTFWGSPCQKLLAEKVEKKTFFLSSFPIDFFYRVFLAVSLHEKPKNTIKIFSKIRPENLKKSQKR
jgi:hypothetical protein